MIQIIPVTVPIEPTPTPSTTSEPTVSATPTAQPTVTDSATPTEQPTAESTAVPLDVETFNLAVAVFDGWFQVATVALCLVVALLALMAVVAVRK